MICPGSSNVWSRGQILIFVKRHCTGVNLVEEGAFCNQCYGNQCFVRFTIDFYDGPPFCKPCHMTKFENAKVQHWAFITLNKRSVNVHSLTLYCIRMTVISIL